MKKEFLGQIPSYLQMIGAIISGPKRFFAAADFSSKALYEKALLTAAISISFSAFFLSRLLNLSYEGESLILFILEQVFVFTASYIIYSWVVFISWRFLGSKEPRIQFASAIFVSRCEVLKNTS